MGWRRSCADVDPWLRYFGSADAGLAQTSTCAASIEGDFFVFAHRGHGSNSYGLGLVARIGALMVDQQIGWGRGYMNAHKGRRCVPNGGCLGEVGDERVVGGSAGDRLEFLGEGCRGGDVVDLLDCRVRCGSVTARPEMPALGA